MFYCKKDDDGDDEGTDELKNHINECVNSYTTYILVDEVKNKEYYTSTSGSKRTKHKEQNPEKKASRIVSVMICEKNVHVDGQCHHFCLIHYLCTYPSMRERGYASTLIKCVFQENGELHNNTNLLCNIITDGVLPEKIFIFARRS